MKERCIDIRCIFFFAVILHRINDNRDNYFDDNSDNVSRQSTPCRDKIKNYNNLDNIIQQLSPLSTPRGDEGI